MKKSKAIEKELEIIREETEMKAKDFYQKHNIMPGQKNHSCEIVSHEDEVLYTLFSNKTTNLY